MKDIQDVRLGVRYKREMPEKVGEILKINGILTYLTERKYPQHFFRRYQGYPISVNILNQLSEKEISIIQIKETNSLGIVHVYTALVNDYQNCMPFKIDGYDWQKCLPIERMRKIR